MLLIMRAENRIQVGKADCEISNRQAAHPLAKPTCFAVKLPGPSITLSTDQADKCRGFDSLCVIGRGETDDKLAPGALAKIIKSFIRNDTAYELKIID